MLSTIHNRTIVQCMIILGIRAQIRIVKLRSGEGQEGQSQAKSSSDNSKLKDLDLSSTLFFGFHHHHHQLFLGLEGA